MKNEKRTGMRDLIMVVGLGRKKKMKPLGLFLIVEHRLALILNFANMHKNNNVLKYGKYINIY